MKKKMNEQYEERRKHERKNKIYENSMEIKEKS